MHLLWVFHLALALGLHANPPLQGPHFHCGYQKLKAAYLSDHARDRRAQGRHTETAIQDAFNATIHQAFLQWDGRWVVRGPKGREHIFESDGTLVTTVNHRTNDRHLSLVRKGDRKAVTAEELAAFRTRLNDLLSKASTAADGGR